MDSANTRSSHVSEVPATRLERGEEEDVKASFISTRAYAVGLPALAPKVAAVYCLFRKGVCVYIGQTSNLYNRSNSNKTIWQVCDLLIYVPNSSGVNSRKQIEQTLAEIFQPSIGMVRRQTVPKQQRQIYKCYICKHSWTSRFKRSPARCPNPKCQSPNYRKVKGK